MNLSVVICTHNPRPEYLARALAALREQTLALAEWELLLIDNASAEPLAGRFDLTWHPNGRHVREEELGLTPARLRGIAEAKGDLLVFVDDDNVLANDYLERALELSHRWEMLGAWGGEITAEFEQAPPKWTKSYWPYLAIREVDRDLWTNVYTTSEAHPCGAGLCVRRCVAEQYRRRLESDPQRRVLDRQGKRLISGGDIDLAMTACDLGMGMGLFKALRLVHLIPRERTTEDYLLRLFESIRYSGYLLQYLRQQPLNLPPKNVFWWLRYVRDVLQLSGRERRFYLANMRAQEAARRLLA